MRMKEVCIKSSAYDTGMNEVDKVQFSDKALLRFGRFLCDMCGADELVIQKSYSDGSGSSMRMKFREDDEEYDCERNAMIHNHFDN